MFDKVLIVRYLNVRNNFCYLGAHATKELGFNVSVMLSGGNGELFFSVSPQLQNIEENAVGISSALGKLLGLKENTTVILSNVGPLPKITSFTIHPLRFEDYHVLDLLKGEVENCLLNQISVVSTHQELLIWIGENLNIPVKVVSVEPSYPGKLDNLTELVILPHMTEAEVYNTNIEQGNNFNIVHGGAPQEIYIDMFCIPDKLSNKERVMDDKIKTYFNNKENYRGRLVSCRQLKSYLNSLCSHEFNVFIHKKLAPISWRRYDSFQEPIWCYLNKIQNNNTEGIIVRVFLIEEMAKKSIPVNNVFVNEKLLRILKSDLGTGCLLKPLVRKEISDEIEVHSNHCGKDLKNILQTYLSNKCNHYELVFNADIPIQLEVGITCSLKFKPKYAKYCCVNSEFLRNCRYSFIYGHIQEVADNDETQDIAFIATSNNREILGDISQNVKNYSRRNQQLGSYLITGDTGSGKSKMIEKLKYSLCVPSGHLYSEVVQSKSLKGKTVDSLHKVLTTILEKVAAHEPAVLFIDDIHILCKNVQDTEAQLQNSLYYDRISEMIYLLLTSMIENYAIGIVATAESTDILNNNIYNSRGIYLFQKQYHIQELTKGDRFEIIKYCFEDHHFEVDIDDCSKKTEGYVFQDIYDLSQRTIFQSVKDDDDKIKKEHFEKALSQMVILSHSDIKLQSPGEKDFSHIGGLDDIKKIMGQSLTWPLKFPSLFNNAPLRLQSGLLLYGPPGTGKTLLAGAAANEYGVRLIAIKGPELLSKYIGASEQGVRNVFLQAQSAKPCILFFDEFDSIAPRRGHDSTGVTDRVVNQLLTQMDGIESLSGVFVLAATSRPDLLDPALLRPGRLDKQIYCSLPDKSSRLDILKVMSKSLNLSDDINLKEIAENTEGFSGADLQYILYNAQLSTMEYSLLSENNKERRQLNPITQEILKSSLHKTRPSLSSEERRKYSLIYSKFEGKAEIDISEAGIRTSLA